jgi:hypothetical protein
MTLPQLIIVLIFVGIGLYLIGLLPMDATVMQIIRVLVVVAVLLYVLKMFMPSFGHFRIS